METVTVEKHIRVNPNQKIWMTKVVWDLLKERNVAFRSGDRALYSAVQKAHHSLNDYQHIALKLVSMKCFKTRL